MGKQVTNRRITVSARMGFVITVGTIIVIAIAFSWFFYYQTLKDLYALRNKINTFKYTVLDLREKELSFIGNAPVNTIFLQSGKSADIDSFNTTLNECYQRIGLLKTSTKFGFIFIGSDLDSLEVYLKNHGLVFNQLSDALYKIGSTESGLLGDLNQAYQSISEKTILLNCQDCMDALMKFSQAENEFVLSKNPLSKFKLNSTADELLASIETSKREAYTIQLLTENINSLRALADELSEQYRLLGRSTENGQNLALETSYAIISKSLHNIEFTINTKINSRIAFLTILSISLILLLGIIFIYFLIRMRRSIVIPLKKLNNYVNLLKDGFIPETDLELPGNSEFNDIANAFNLRIDSLRKAVIFANNITNKKYDEEFSVISEKDLLGRSLIAMRESLKANELEIQTRAVSDNQQKWASAGIAAIGEILNKNYKSTQEFGFNIISTLVKYIDANQGGIFFINNENPADIYLESKASFAYDRRRYMQKRVELGEGYLGTCVVEKKSIFNKELPKDYIVITSGLGDAPPHILMVVPLISDNEVFGAIEIASFKIFEDYQKEFIERVCESIATTIAGVKIKEQTEQLYKATKEQSEKIAQDEEEMRQNLEEMQATQEEAYRREKLLKQQLEEANAKIKELEKGHS